MASSETNDRSRAAELISPALLDIVSKIPKTKVRKSPAPEADARRLGKKAAIKAAVAAGALALPTGPLGWLTLMPELRSVWRIQVQLIADIAALHGKKSDLTREQVLYCLFKHDAAGAFRDIIVQVGDRFLVRRASAQVLQYIARRLAIRLTQRVIGKGLARWLPVIGAAGVGAYAFHETSRIAETALSLFRAGIEVDVIPADDAG